jgi:hypothetical protein
VCGSPPGERRALAPIGTTGAGCGPGIIPLRCRRLVLVRLPRAAHRRPEPLLPQPSQRTGDEKLKLNLHALRVESFDTRRAAGGARGTVRGRVDDTSQDGLCTLDAHRYTCGVSCVWECDGTVIDPVCFG